MSSVIFLGTPSFGSAILQDLADQRYDVKAVVTQPNERVGCKQVVHQSAVKQTTLKRNLPVHQPAKLSGSDELAESIKIEPDFIVTAAYGQFLPAKSLKSARIAPINVHDSLLPRYRGGVSAQYSVLNGNKETGVAIIEMIKKMDVGDIFSQKALPIENGDANNTLFDKLSILGRDLLLETLPEFIDGTVTCTPQNEDRVVFSPNISKEQEQIKLAVTAEQTSNLTHALNPDPGAYVMLDGKRFKIWKTKPLAEKTSFPAGTLVIDRKKFVISMAGGSELELLGVRPTGKKKMNIKDYLGGQGSHFISGEKIIDE